MSDESPWADPDTGAGGHDDRATEAPRTIIDVRGAAQAFLSTDAWPASKVWADPGDGADWGPALILLLDGHAGYTRVGLGSMGGRSRSIVVPTRAVLLWERPYPSSPDRHEPPSEDVPSV